MVKATQPILAIGEIPAMKRLWLSLGLCLLVASAHADSYAFVDAQTGVIHLTDRPLSARYELVVKAPEYERPVNTEFDLGPRGVPPTARGLRRRHYSELIHEASAKTGVRPELLHAMVTAESDYNPEAVSPKGALGLMQLMPETARRYGVSVWNDPAQNLSAGAQHLAYLLERFDHNLKLAVAAYNAGEHAVIRHGYKVPPYPETQNYVQKVASLYERFAAAARRH